MESTPLRSVALITATRVSVTLCSVLSITITTPVLGPAGMGALNLVMSAANLFGLLNAAVSLYFYRQVLEWQHEGRLRINLKRYVGFLGAAGVVVALVCPMLYAIPESPWGPVPVAWTTSLVAGQVVLAALSGALLHLLNTFGRRLAFGLLSNLVCWGGLCMAWLVTAQGQATAERWMSGLLVAHAVAAVLAGLVLLPDLKSPAVVTTPDDASADFSPAAILRFSWPLLLCNLMYWAQRSSFSPWLADRAGTAVLGMFSVAFSLGMQAVLSFDTLFRELYGPHYWRAIARASPQAQVCAWERYAAAFFPMLVAWVVLVCICGDALLDLLTDRPFHGLGAMVAWGALAQFWTSVNSTFQVLTSSRMDNRALLISNLVGAVISVGLLVVAPADEAMLGAAVAINVGLAVAAGLSGWLLQRQFPHRLPVPAVVGTLLAMLPMGLVLLLTGLPRHLDARALVVLTGVMLYTLLVLRRSSRAWLGDLR